MAIPNKTGESFNPQNAKEDSGGAPMTQSAIVSYLLPKLHDARIKRDAQGRKERWEEYTRLWRGMWGDRDKNRDSERSKLIAPALQQAIEMTVAEMVEATFGRTAWLDIDDDIADEEKDDATMARDYLLEDFENSRVPDAIRETFLLGAIYGTGISKVDVVEKVVREPYRDAMSGEMKVQKTNKVCVELVPIRPDQFIIDPAALHVDDALFCGHELLVPKHIVEQKQGSGAYRKGYVGTYDGGFPSLPKPDGSREKDRDVEGVLVTELFCRLPKSLMPQGEVGPDGRVECIVVLGNEYTLLKAIPSPFTMQDRPIIAYQHEKVPGEFWGRGVAEKGYNPQKALDAELRARIDALALTTAPMMGADVTRMPRNPDLRVRPGKTWLTRGKPSEILEPIQFAPINPATFQQTGDLERMVQMGTGAMDSATPNNISRRNETASGMSQLNSAFIKRAKMTMHNIEQNYLDPLVKKALWRYMQFDPTRYKADYKFVVNSTMGIMAREFEQSQLTQLIGFVPPDSPAHKILLGAILTNTTSANEKELRAAFAQLTKPPSKEEQQMQQQMQQLLFQSKVLEVEQLRAEVEKTRADAELAKAKAYFELIKADLEDDKVEIQAANAVTGAERTKGDGMKTRASLAGKVLDNETKREQLRQQRQTPTKSGGG
jgi:hypothetical protein